MFLSKKAVMVWGNELSRSGKFQASFRVESFASDNSSSDGETQSQRLSGTRQKHRRKTFQELVNEMSTSTRKLEEETSGLLRDLDSLRNQNLNTCRRLQRIQRVSCAVKHQIETFPFNRSAAVQPQTNS